MVYTTRLPAADARSGRNASRTRATPARHRPEERPPQPPHHPGQGRTLPADPEEVAPRPTRQPPPSPSCRPCSTPSSRSTTTSRPHRSLPHRATPATIYSARPKAAPSGSHRTDDPRPRPPRPDRQGRAASPCASPAGYATSAIGRTHARTYVLLLVQDLEVTRHQRRHRRVLRELTIDLTRDYQPPGRPPGPPRDEGEPPI